MFICLLGTLVLFTSCATTGRELTDADMDALRSNPHLPVSK